MEDIISLLSNLYNEDNLIEFVMDIQYEPRPILEVFRKHFPEIVEYIESHKELQ